MKILVLADVESKYYWDYFRKEKLEGIDLVLSCGDLKSEYLSFIATYVKVPVLYVRGNHDDDYEQNPPDGCICIEDKIYEYNGVRILGLGGSLRYKDGKNQYTQWEMKRRILKLLPKIWFKGGFDILLTHAPAYQLHDNSPDDHVHEGFKGFLTLMEKFQPRYMVHGHIHLNYSWNNKRERRYRFTTIVNGYERYIFDYK